MGGINSNFPDIDYLGQQSLVHTLSQIHINDVSLAFHRLDLSLPCLDSSVNSQFLVESLPLECHVAQDLLAILNGEDSETVDVTGIISTLAFFSDGFLKNKLDLYFKLRGWNRGATLCRKTVQACLTHLLYYTDRVYASDPWMKHTGDGSSTGRPESFSVELMRELECTSGTDSFTYSDIYPWLMAFSKSTSAGEIHQDKDGPKNENASNNAISPIQSPTHYTWLPIVSDAGSTALPSSRSKHAIAVHGNHIYLYGGRDGSIGHKDMWRFEIATNKWQRLLCRGDRPNLLQEHSMVTYQGKLYVFGGEFSASWSKDVPLWVLDIASLVWMKHVIPSEVSVPCSRRGQTAVIFGKAIHIYGGYMDLKGSSSELWTFDLEAGMWHLAYSTSMSGEGPGSRHSHSAVVHDKSMWVYGGMSDLQPRGDLWRWEFDIRKWTKIKSKNGPPALVGHTACNIPGAMLLYGGESSGTIQSDLWKFTFASQTWTKLGCGGVVPCGRLYHEVVVLPAFILQQAWLAAGTERSNSAPHLQASPPPHSSHNQRPMTSPDTTASHQPKLSIHNFRNKIIPVDVDQIMTIVRHGDDTETNVLVHSRKGSSVLGHSKDKFYNSDSVEVLNENAVHSLDEQTMQPLDCQKQSAVHNNLYSVADHARVVRKHIQHLARFKQINTGSLCRLLSNSSDHSEYSESCTFENPLFNLNRSDQCLESKTCFDKTHVLRSVSVESMLSMGHNDKLPPPYWLDHNRSRLIDRDVLETAIKSKSWDSLLKNFGGMELKSVDINKDPNCFEMKSFDSDIILEDLEACDIDYNAESITQMAANTPTYSFTQSIPTVEKESSFTGGNGRHVLDAWTDLEPLENYYSQEDLEEDHLIVRNKINGSVPDILIDIKEKHNSGSQSQFPKYESETVHKSALLTNTEYAASKPSQIVEMDDLAISPHSSANTTKKDYIQGQTFKTYISQRGMKTGESVHMFVFGGKESESCNIGINPLPIWRLDISI